MSWKRRDRRPSSAAARFRLPLAILRHQFPAKVLDRDADRRQRGLQVVAQRRQQRRREIGLLADELGGVALAEELRSLDRNRDDAAQRIEGAEIEVRCDRREKPHRLHAVAEWHDRDASLRVADAHVAAIRALAGVELQRPTGFCERGIQDIDVDRDVTRPTLVNGPAIVAGQSDGHLGELESACHLPGEGFHRGGSVGRQQDVPCQVEEAGDFVATCDGLTLASLRRRRQIAGDDGDGQKGEERDPVLRIGDGQCPNRRQKEEIEGEHRHDGHDDRDTKPRHRGGAEHDQEQRQRHGGFAHVRQQPEERDRDTKGGGAEEERGRIADRRAA